MTIKYMKIDLKDKNLKRDFLDIVSLHTVSSDALVLALKVENYPEVLSDAELVGCIGGILYLKQELQTKDVVGVDKLKNLDKVKDTLVSYLVNGKNKNKDYSRLDDNSDIDFTKTSLDVGIDDSSFNIELLNKLNMLPKL